jgi:hypothetical protein
MGYSSMVMADNINGNGDGPGGRNETYRGPLPVPGCAGTLLTVAKEHAGSVHRARGEESPVARACRERVSGAEPLGEVFE